MRRMSVQSRTVTSWASEGVGLASFRYGLGLLGGLFVGLLLWYRPYAQPVSPTMNPEAAAPAGEYAWTNQPPPSFPLPPYARFLKGVTIVLDPGHVGQRDPGGNWKRGPTGLREAVVNLHVARFLREFLESAGARVVLTRDKDESLDLPNGEDLRQRVLVANRLGADLFVSIHHNAVSNDTVNYTTVFYHADGEAFPASLDVGRHLLTGLDHALRLERHLPCALQSDYLLHPNRGFAVLREVNMPAVLTEASFHTNPAEETRLRDPVYNRREAYGLFLGIARWARGGLPQATIRGGSNRVRGGQELAILLDDGLTARGGNGAEQLRVKPASIIVRLGDTYLPFELDTQRRSIRVRLPNSMPTSSPLFVDFQNIFGHHVVHPNLRLVPR